MDISKLDIVGASNNGFDIDILHPLNGEPTGLKIRVVGAMSTNYKDDMALLFAELEEFTEANKVDEKASKKEQVKAKLKIEKFDDQLTAKFLAKYTKGWEGMQENGKDIEFSESEAERIYLNYPIIKGQVQKGMMTVANFIKA